MGKVSAVATFQLFIGRAASTIIVAVGTIVLGMVILESDYGLYTVALIPATTFLLFQDWGVTSALTRYCAKCRAANEENPIRNAIKTTLIFEAGTGAALTAISLVTAAFLGSTVFHKPESGFLIALSSATIFASAMGGVAASVFTGFEKMKLTGITLLGGAVVQSVLGPLLVIAGYGALGAVVGYTLGAVFSTAISIVLLYVYVVKKLPPASTKKLDFTKTLRPLLSFGVPFASAAILSGLVTQFTSFMMAAYCSNDVIGAYRIALNFTLLLNFVTIPISTMLFPAFSKIDAGKEPEVLQTVFKTSVKYTSFLLVPASMAVIALGASLIGTIYGNKWLDAPFFLTLLVAQNFFVLLGNMSIYSLVPALGETKYLMKINAVYLLVAVAMGFVLIPQFGMVGVLTVLLLSGLPSMVIMLFKAWKHYRVAFDLKDSVRILAASSIAFVATYLFQNFFVSLFVVKLVAGCALFLAVFLVAAPVAGAITSEDIVNFRLMFSSMGVISKLLEVPLTVMDAVTSLTVKYANRSNRGGSSQKKDKLL
jgi:O-antigen/teichoic acid export membrane protein